MALLWRRALLVTLLCLLGMVVCRRGGGGVSAMQLKSPPSYCSKDMSRNEIPSLAESVSSSFAWSVAMADVQLLQVQSFIRHGARTPYTKPQCWAGYDFVWDCNVTEVVSSSPGSKADAPVTGLFKKRYDARPEKNTLGGTCAVGQLLGEGYEQEKQNGLHMRKAYVCDDGPWCLFANDSAADLQASGSLYLRSDDEQRTVMSGQIMASSMLNVSNTVLVWHTMDDDVDYIDPNENACPRLKELSGAAYSSQGWTDKLASAEHQTMNDSMHAVWGGRVLWWDVLDCLMTTACTGRALPDGMTEALFEEAVAFSTFTGVYQSSYNNASYAKLSMARLTSDIRGFLEGAVNGTHPVKFVLWSGHDTTFIPLLTAIAPGALDEEWPPYASLATIELLRIGGEMAGDYFRLVYNGKVIRLDGCNQDVCAISAFLKATQYAVDLSDDEHCALTGDGTPTRTPPPATSETGVNSTMSPTTTASLSATDSAQEPNKSDRSSVAIGSSNSARGSDGDTGNGTNLLGVMVSCFLIGAIFIAVPAFFYFRRFRYEAMREFGLGRDGGHSYEMT